MRPLGIAYCTEPGLGDGTAAGRWAGAFGAGTSAQQVPTPGQIPSRSMLTAERVLRPCWVSAKGGQGADLQPG